MMNPVAAWNTFWFKPVSGRPLGLFRILIGLVALAQLGMLAIDLDYWLTDRGIMLGTEARELAGPLRFSVLQYVQDPASVRLYFAGMVAVTVLFTLGWRTRVNGVLLYLGMLSIHHRIIPTNCGPDNLLLILLFYLMLSPCGRAYSLDARRASRKRGGTLAEPLIAPWGMRLIQLQMGLLYLNTAVLKCRGGTWLGGTVLHFVINNPEITRLDLTFLSQYPVLLNVMSHGVLALEFLLPVLIWSRPTRGWVIAGGVALHGGIMLMINVPLFGEMMMACYLLFLGPEEFDALVRVVNPVGWFRAKTGPGVVVPGRVDPAEPLRGPHEPATVAAVESLPR